MCDCFFEPYPIRSVYSPSVIYEASYSPPYTVYRKQQYPSLLSRIFLPFAPRGVSLRSRVSAPPSTATIYGRVMPDQRNMSFGRGVSYSPSPMTATVSGRVMPDQRNMSFGRGVSYPPSPMTATVNGRVIPGQVR